MKTLAEIIEALREMAARQSWAAGHADELMGVADELEAVMAAVERQREYHYKDLLAKAMKGETHES